MLLYVNLITLITVFWAAPHLNATYGPEPLHVLGENAWEGGHKFRQVVAPPGKDDPNAFNIRYAVLVEGRLADESATFSIKADQVLADPRGWRRAGVNFVRTNDLAEADIKLLLARPKVVDKLCKPLDTGGRLSCAMYGRANFNVERWTKGAATWKDDIEGYHFYLIQHEVGHLLGMRHEKCPGAGHDAPVMMPQTKRVGLCSPHGQPQPDEVETLRRKLPALRSKLEKRRARKRR